MAVQQKIQFLKEGFNSDVSAELNQGLPFARNIRIFSTDGNDGAITTVNGNTPVTFTLPKGTNKCIGYERDALLQMGYAFIYNASDNHSILQYNETTNVITAVFIDDTALTGVASGSILNFQPDFLITGIDIVALDKDNHLLKFTDNYVNTSDASDYNEPKSINIEQGILFVASAGTGTPFYSFPFSSKFIDAIKEPPPAPSYVWSGLDTNILQFQAECAQYIESLIIPTLVQFPSTSGQFDTVTYQWTVPTTGYYNLELNLGMLCDTGGATCDATIEIKNETTSVVVYSITYSGATTIDDITGVVLDTSTGAVLYTAGDIVDVTIIITPSALGVSLVIGYPLADATNIFSSYFLGEDIFKLNNLFKRLFQFQSSYRFKDGEQSALSSKTDFIMPVTSLGTNSTGEDFVLQDDTITIDVETGSSIVKSILIYGHEIGQTDGDTLSDTSLIIELDKELLDINDDVTYSYVFLNDGNYTPISLAKKNQLMDFVPYYAQSQEFFKSRLGYGDVTESVDAVAVDMRFPQDFTQLVDVNTNSFFPKRSYLKSGGIYEQGIVYKFNGKRLSTANTTSGDSDTLQNNGNYGTRMHIPFLTQSAYTSPHNTPNTDMSYVPTIEAFIYNHPPADAESYEIVRSKNQAISNYIQFVSRGLDYYTVGGAITTGTSPTAYSVILNIANIIGVYKDENQLSQLVYDWTKGDRIRFIANRKYMGGYNSTQIDAFFAFNDSEIVAFNPSTQNISLLMSGQIPQNLSTSANGAGNVLFEIYTPAKSITNDNELMFEVTETGTIGTDIHGNKIHIPSTGTAQLFSDFSDYTFASPNLTLTMPFGHGVVVNDNVKATGIDNAWSIYGVVTISNATDITIDTTGFAMFGVFADTIGEVAKCSEQEFTSGDCFRRYCNMPFDIIQTYRLYQYIETMDASNMFDSQAWDYGRPNRIDNNAKRTTTPARIVYTENIIPNTNVNGLSTIYDTNFEDYNGNYGGIMKLFFQNDRLQAYQKLKVLPILVGQQNIESPEGNGNLTSSTQVLAPQQKIDYYLEDYGIGEHPESWAYYSNSKYFFDVKRAAIVRLSQNGLTNLPMEANMRVFFADLCQKILLCNKKVNCVGVYDVRYGEYILSVEPFTYEYLGDVLVFDGVTIAWNEKMNQFSTTYSYIPEMMGQTGVDILSFKDGELWLHNLNTIQNNFYGKDDYSEIWFYVNLDASKVKVLQAISQETNANWLVASIVTPNGQETRMMFDSNWVKKENNYYAYVKMDINTPNVTNAIIQGNPMRDRTFLVKMTYSKETFSKLYAVNALVVPSERSNK